MAEIKTVLTDPQVRGLAVCDGGGYQDDKTADWEFTDDGLQKLARAIEAAVLSDNAGKVPRPIATAPKNGREILVHFKQHGWKSCSWCDQDGNPNSEYALWHVDDHKHGPFPVRGYCEGDDTHWMELPESPTQQAIDAGKV